MAFPVRLEVCSGLGSDDRGTWRRGERLSSDRPACSLTCDAQVLRRALSAFSILRSVLYWLSAYTAQIAAGSQPMRVTCKIKQMMPAIGRPIVKKATKGRRMARMRRKVFSPWLV